MPTEEWISRAKKVGKLTDGNSQEIVESCFLIFGEDLGEKLPTEKQSFSEQLFLPRPWKKVL